MIAYLVFFTIGTYMLTRLLNPKIKKNEEDELDILLLESKKYSYIDEGIYGNFFSNIRMAENSKKAHPDISRQMLRRALHQLKALPLYLDDVDKDIEADINIIASKIEKYFSM